MADPSTPADQIRPTEFYPQAARLWAMRAAFRTMGAVAPRVAARFAEEIFCRPPRPQPRPHEESFLAAGERFTVPGPSGPLAAWRWGRGPVVVLLHGWGSRAGRFVVLAPALVDAGFQAVAFDAPAHGASAGVRASMPEFAAALLAVCDALGPVHAVVGHSLGGAATALAIGRGLAPRRAVLISAPADVGVFSERFARHLGIAPHVRSTMERNLETRLRMRWADLHLPTLARSQTTPLLLLHDHDDPDVPVSEAEALAAAWPGARLETTRGLGHRMILRSPAVARRVVGFVADDRG